MFKTAPSLFPFGKVKLQLLQNFTKTVCDGGSQFGEMWFTCLCALCASVYNCTLYT